MTDAKPHGQKPPATAPRDDPKDKGVSQNRTL